jgi:hypothetical protein
MSNHKFDSSIMKFKRSIKNVTRKIKMIRSPKKKRIRLWKRQERLIFQIGGSVLLLWQEGHKSPKCPDKGRPKRDWVINKTQEAAFIQTAVQARGDQLVVSAWPAMMHDANSVEPI